MKICSQCIMDETDPNITFNDNSVCNHCLYASVNLEKYIFTRDQENSNLKELKTRIKKRSKSKKYDSIIGLSGGVDSSYVAYLAYKMGLNPICVHFDNGWNTDISVKNIKKIINVTNFDLYTHVIDWNIFKDIQRSFIKAGVVDIEMVTDHAIFSSLLKVKKKFSVNTVLSGNNFNTEHGMPSSWTWSKMDSRNIKAIHKIYGSVRDISSYPSVGNIRWLLIQRFSIGWNWEEPLNLINYNKTEAMSVLNNFFDWEYYGGKHHESLFTKFYQSYILPKKYNIDKRKSHLSCQIRTGEISRNEALEEIKNPYYEANELINDKKFFLKKLSFREEEFEELMDQKPVMHDYFPSDQVYIKPLIKLGKFILGNKK